MNQALQFVAQHGPVLLFAAVFVEQFGVPLPATPWLLAAGALGASGRLDLSAAVAAATAGSVIADVIWFYLGRRAGIRALNLLCRVSLEPDSCVQRTQTIFSRHGMRGLFLAKFIPGLSMIAPPLAGMSGVTLLRFLLFDGTASAVYCGGFVFLGVLFSEQLEKALALLGSLGSGAIIIIVILLALYVGKKYLHRRKILKELEMARITVDELHALMLAGKNPVILDVRGAVDIEHNPFVIPGALRLAIEGVQSDACKPPPGSEVILYCACPNEAGAARMASLLRKKGVARVRPLLGGIEAWQSRNYPVEQTTAIAVGVA